MADESEQGLGLPDAEIADRVGVHERTVSKLRQRCVEQGLQAALERQARKRERSRVLDGDGEAQLVALLCGKPPSGQSRWTLHVAADRLVQRDIVESISHETVRQVFKKNTAKTLAADDVGHSAKTGRGMCVCHGTRAGCVPTSDKAGLPGRMDETSVQCVRAVRPRCQVSRAVLPVTTLKMSATESLT